MAKIIRNAFFLMALLVFLSGFSTAFWAKKEGLVVSGQLLRMHNASYQIASRSSGSFDGAITWPKVRYRFSVDGENYSGSTYCLCIPIGLPVLGEGKLVTVRYLPFLPSVSVIKMGADMALTTFLVLFGVLWHLAFAARSDAPPVLDKND